MSDMLNDVETHVRDLLGVDPDDDLSERERQIVVIAVDHARRLTVREISKRIEDVLY